MGDWDVVSRTAAPANGTTPAATPAADPWAVVSRQGAKPAAMTREQAMAQNRATSNQSMSNQFSQQFGLTPPGLPAPQVGQSKDIANMGPRNAVLSVLRDPNQFGKIEQAAGDERRYMQRAGDQGIITPTETAIGTYPASVLEKVGQYGQGMVQPKNLALSAAAMVPPLRPVVGAYMAGTGGKQIYDATTDTTKPLGGHLMSGYANPDQLENLLLGLSGVSGGAAGIKEGFTPKPLPRTASRAAMNAFSREDYSPEAHAHVQGTANDMGFKPKAFEKGNPDAHLNADAVHEQAGRNLAKQYDGLVQSISGKISQLPALGANLKAKLAAQFTAADQPQIAARIMSGDTTVGDLETIRKELNRTYKDPVYSSPEQAALKGFRKSVANQVYSEIGNTGMVDPAQLQQLKSLQGELIQNEKGFSSGTTAAGTQNNIANSGTPLQNFMRKSPLMKFKGGAVSGATKVIAGSADKAALLEQSFKNMQGQQPYQIQVNPPQMPGALPLALPAQTQTNIPMTPQQVAGTPPSTPPPPFNYTTKAQRFGRLLPAPASTEAAQGMQPNASQAPSRAGQGAIPLAANVPSSVDAPAYANYVTHPPTGTPVEAGTAAAPVQGTVSQPQSRIPQAQTQTTEPQTTKLTQLPGIQKSSGSLYDRALEIAKRDKSASATTFQKELGISFGSAVRLMDILEEHEVIGPAEGPGPRPLKKTTTQSAPAHGSGGVSAEEVSRPGVNYVISKTGQPTYHGKAFDPGGIPDGAVHVSILDDGSVRTNMGAPTKIQDATIQRLKKDLNKR